MAESTIIAPNSVNAKKAKISLGTFVLIAALLAELFFLLYDVPIFNTPDILAPGHFGPPIAELLSHENQVKTQGAGDLVWEEASKGQTLFRRQSLLTLDRSKAEIAFLDGTGLLVDENSLVQIEKSPSDDSSGYQKIVVRLLRGTIRKTKPKGPSQILRGKGATVIGQAPGSVTPEFEIQVGETVTSVPAMTELTVSASPEKVGGANITVQSGELSIKSSDGKSIEVKKDEEAVLSTSRGVPQIDVRPIAKAAPAIAPTAATPPASITKPQVKAAPKTKAVRKPATKQIPPKKKKLAPPTPEMQAPEFRIRKKPTSFIEWLIPSAHAEDLSWDVILKWKPVVGARGYRLQIGRESTFKNMLINTEVKGAEYVWFYEPGMENTKGRVFYRLASVDETGEAGPFSEAIPLFIPQELLAAAKEGKKPKISVAERAAVAAKAPPPTAAPVPPPPTQITSNWGAAIHTGLGDLKQKTTDTSLTEVNAQKPYLQQKLLFSAETTRTRGTDETVWTLNMDSVLASFSKPDETRTTVQPTVKTFTLRADLLRSLRDSGSHYDWNVATGIRFDRNFRWVKSGPQSVEARGALSVGPLVGFMRKYSSSPRLAIQETGLLIGAPFTGLFLPGYYGADARIWAEWKLVPLSKNWIGLRPEGEIGYHRWRQPEGTTVFSWNLWVALSFHSSEI